MPRLVTRQDCFSIGADSKRVKTVVVVWKLLNEGAGCRIPNYQMACPTGMCADGGTPTRHNHLAIRRKRKMKQDVLVIGFRFVVKDPRCVIDSSRPD